MGNPASSFIRHTAEIIQLVNERGGVLHLFDACAYGGVHYKPNGWLTSAGSGSKLARKCPGQPPSNVHETLSGQEWDPTTEKWVWKTKQAQEYSNELCKQAAKVLKADLPRRPAGAAPAALAAAAALPTPTAAAETTATPLTTTTD